jgi:hypothetical protein
MICSSERRFLLLPACCGIVPDRFAGCLGSPFRVGSWSRYRPGSYRFSSSLPVNSRRFDHTR